MPLTERCVFSYSFQVIPIERFSNNSCKTKGKSNMLADLKIANKLILISDGELYHLRGSKIKVVLINRNPY